ncbi:MAG: phosphopantetheine-binding protein [Anaerolineae bacterium]|nr:phosphopantetheine-binding protein [Anaerolineae bacterium]MCO5190215.1 phosphopantetheine-binding protein [Anaerolineae bacterium]MCO5196798.1 phosphopantetheine-binding protein [Anaerolineae bacterium]MCO5205118.1 phosphopantetheine-binding protein [Anaerolineae bacterium]
MKIATISRDELTLKIFDLLAMIAPEADFDDLDPNVDMRDELDIDSFDFLNFLIDLNDEVGVEIPEADYGKLVSLNDLLDYLLARM